MKKYWYHVTNSTEWGDEIKLKPRIPSSVSLDEDMSPLEPVDVERICVAPTPVHCYAAIHNGCRVYRTKEPVQAKRAKGVPDSNITQEHWITKPCDFVYVCDIPKWIQERIVYSAVGSNLKSDLKKQQARMNCIHRMFKQGSKKLREISDLLE